MNLRALERLGRGLYYAPHPALTVGPGGRIVDYNLAIEALAPDDLNGSRGEAFDTLLGRLQRRVIEGVLGPRGLSPGETSRCVLDAPGLGPVVLHGQTVDCRDPADGSPAGRVVSWKVATSGGNDAFHQLYRVKLDHELKWDTYARSYDRILGLMPYYQDVVDRHRAALDDAGDGPIIDLGAGTGNLVERLIADGRHVTAVDSSRAMLDKLRSKASLADQIGRRLRVVEASIASLPMFEDDAFAGASILLTLFDMEDPERALDTAIRLIRPGAVLVVTELKRCLDVEPILRECESRLRQLGRYEELRDDLDRVVNSNRAIAPGSRSQFRAEQVHESLSARGFLDLSWVESHFRQCATVRGRKPPAACQPRGGEGSRP